MSVKFFMFPFLFIWFLTVDIVPLLSPYTGRAMSTWLTGHGNQHNFDEHVGAS